MNLNAMQRTAVITALEKALKDEKARLREESDNEAIELYESFGTDRIKIKLGDTEIATLTICFSQDEYTVFDEKAFHDFLLANGMADIKESIRPEAMPEAIRIMKEADPGAIEETVVIHKDADKFLKHVGEVFVIEGTNEVVPGISPKPSEIKGTHMTGCKPDVVLPALNALPGTLETLLLGGGSDE